MPFRLITLLLLTALCVWVECAEARQSRLLPLHDQAYRYIERLQRRGLLLSLPPTALPYTEGDVATALEALDAVRLSPLERRWVRLIAATLPPPHDGVQAGAALSAGLRAAGSDRLDALRPTDEGTALLQAGALRLFPTAALTAYLEADHAVAQLGLRHDVYFELERFDRLDPARRLYIRNEDTYAGYARRWFGIYLGRYAARWAPAGSPALLLSGEAPPFDHLSLRLGGGRLAVRSLVGELDAMHPDGTFDGRAFEPGAVQRLLAAHRIDWRPTPFFQLSLMESIVFSGEGAGPSLKYLNPLLLAAFAVDNRPKNDENNGLLAGLLWLHHRGWTLHGQLLLDDLDVAGESGERPAFALGGSLVRAAGLFDAGIDLEVVAARTYNAPQPAGRYTYLRAGLGTPFSDYVRAGAFTDVYADALLPGLTLTPRADVLWQGERDLRQPYPTREEDADIATILHGTVERTLRLGAVVHYQPDPRVWVRLDAGVNRVENAGHVMNSRRTRFSGLLEVGARLSLRGPIRLALP